MDICSKSDCLDIGIGLLLPTSSFCDRYFSFILDEDNHLWYVDRERFSYSKDELTYPIVFFTKGEDFMAKNIKYCDPSLGEILEKWRIRSNSYGLPDSDTSIDNLEFTHIRYSSLFYYDDYGVKIFSFYKNDLDKPIAYRLFIYDISNNLYHQVNNNYAQDLYLLLYNTNKTSLPFDCKSIYDIFKLVKEFNPYEVFESYRIEIEHHVQSRIGKDNYYYEYKSYSIKYIDKYLEKWFSKGKSTLYKDSGYTSNFQEENPYKRFYDEEDKAKCRAYKEYNKQDHFDCLMEWYYQRITDHYLAIRENKPNNKVFKYFNLIGNSIKIKEAYRCLNSLFGHAFDYSIPSKEDVKRLMLYGIKKYNSQIKEGTN